MSLIILFITFLFAFLDLEDLGVVSTGKRVGIFYFFFFPNRVLTWRIAKLTSHSCHSTYKAENLFAALSQGNMYLEIFRNTLNFFKPLLSGKMSCYYGGRGQFVWLIHKYVTLTQLSRMIFNKGSSILLEEHSTTLSLHWYFISRVL